MSQKVERLLNKENAIVHAPGSADSSASWSKVIPLLDHIMSPLQKMEKCRAMIAQAGKDETSAHTPWRRRKRLARQHAEFLQWFKTKGLKKINLTALVTCDSAKGVGKKGKKATGVRKGGRNAGKAPPTVVVDRIRFTAEPLPQQCSIEVPITQFGV